MYITFFWAILLLFGRRHENKAKHFLGIFMTAAFLIYLSHAIFFNQHHDIYLYFDPLYTFASLSVYPLYYWYIKLLTIESDLNFKNIRLLLPAIIMSIASIIVYLLMTAQQRQDYIEIVLFNHKNGEINGLLFTFQKVIYYVSRFVFSIQVIYFLFAGSRLVVRYNHNIENFYSNLESKTIRWVKLLLWSFVITSIMSIVFNILGKTVFIDSAAHLLIPSAIFSMLLFTIGFQGYMQNYTVADFEIDIKETEEIDVKKFNQQKLKEALVMLFQDEQIYKQVDLKITHVSGMLNTNRTYLSNIINKDFSCSFSEFVNKYRILETKKLLEAESSKNYSLDHISEKVGFGSLHTFIRVFKESEGITPGRYRDHANSQS